MPDITNPQAVAFANGEVRVIADKYAQLYYALDAFLNEWNAQGIGTLIPNTADVIVDGSATDGRAQITGTKVNGLVTNLTALRTDLEANANQKLNVLLQVAVNPVR